MLLDSNGLGNGNIVEASKNKNPSFSSERAKIPILSSSSIFSTIFSTLSQDLDIKTDNQILYLYFT